MSLRDYRHIAESLNSGKRTKIPAMKVSDLTQVLWWIRHLQWEAQ